MNNIIHYKIKKDKFRFLFLLLLSSFLSVSGTLYASNLPNDLSIEVMMKQKMVTLTMENRPIRAILQEIYKQSAISFAIDEAAEKSLTNLSINVKNVSVEQALNSLLKDSGYTYAIKNNMITLVKTQSVKQDKQSSKITVKGKIIDDEKKPIAGATVIVIGTSIGAISDEKGEFTITCDKNAKAEVSFVGMLTKLITLTDSQQNLVIAMEKDAIAVDDVVVTGLMTRKKSGFAGTANVITKADLKKVSTGNIFTTISTFDAGFKINKNNLEGSNPNVLPDFTIRGKGSFQNGSTSPIFIVDGFEVTSQKVFDMDVNRIESITLLKDASATILYGSRASNGVVVIETVAPKSGKLTVTYDFKPTIGVVDLSDYDLMNAKEKLEYERLAGLYTDNDYYEQNNLYNDYYKRYHNILAGADTYWLKQPVKNEFSHAHSLNVQGGDNVIRYGIDLGYNSDNGVMKGSGRDRFSLAFTLIYRIKDKVTLSNKVNYGHVKSTESPYGKFSTYAKLNPYEMPRNMKGELTPLLSNGDANPIYDAELPSRNFYKAQDFNDQFSVDWNINKEFRFKGQISITKTDGKGEIYTSPFASKFVMKEIRDEVTGNLNFLPTAERGELTQSFDESLEIATNFTLNYNKIINRHIIYTGIGAELKSFDKSNSGYTVTGFVNDDASDPAFALQFKKDSRAVSGESKTRSIGFFANVNYIYDDRFFGDFSFRYDGSSKFGAENRFAPFWSAGAGWNVHNEKFFKANKKIVDMFKLRYSYGVTGNQEFSAYQAMTTYKFVTDTPYYNSIGATLMGFGNKNLKWQNQYQSNIGLDLGFMESRFRLNFNYYNKRTTGMLTSITVAPSLGIYNNNFLSNVGEIKNTGYELNANAVIIRKPAKGIEWAVNFQGAHNKNKLVEISNELKNLNDKNNLDTKIPLNVYEEGQSMTALKAVRSLGIDPSSGREMFLNSDGKLTYDWDARDKVLCGDTEPKFFGNIGTNLYFKGWNLNISFRYSMGADYYNETLAKRVEGNDPKLNADRRALNDRWIQPGDRALFKNIKEYKSTYVSTRFVQRENFLEMSNLSLSYEFKAEQLKKIKLNTLRLSFYANDLLRFSTIKNERGLSYPFQRSFVFGLNVSF
ncbi:MAG: SusC/RagA family TonB-linked outer membrane protein [Rikenellaceae bacterium]